MMFDYIRELHSQISKSFEKHSSPIDWCEANYGVTPEVAEFYNTISNGIFFVLPPTLIYLFGQFGRQHSRKVQFIWLLMIGIGAASAYFHATLSLAGQLMDEFGILWVFNATLAFWLPRNFLPKILKDDEQVSKLLLFRPLAGVWLSTVACQHRARLLSAIFRAKMKLLSFIYSARIDGVSGVRPALIHLTAPLLNMNSLNPHFYKHPSQKISGHRLPRDHPQYFWDNSNYAHLLLSHLNRPFLPWERSAVL